MLKILRWMRKSAIREKMVALSHIPRYGIEVQIPSLVEPPPNSSGNTSVKYCKGKFVS
jgi:hypothetical protein